MNTKQIEQGLMAFRNDQNAKELREQYRQKSFLEIYGKSRSEDVHSSFVAWLLEGKDIPGDKQDNTILWFLDILMRRAEEQNPANFPPILRNAINNCDLTLDINGVQKEDAQSKTERADIVVDCCANFHNNGRTCNQNVLFVIENKVTSAEHNNQTQRYYNTYTQEFPGSIIIFVYLTPCRSEDLVNWSTFSAKPSSVKFICINYQDLLDGVILPVLSKTELSTRLRCFIEDYVENLYIPTSEEKDSKRIVMAINREQQKLVENVWDSHHDILKEAVEASRRKVWGTTPKSGDNFLIAFLNSQKDFFESIFSAVADYHSDDAVRVDAVYYSNRIKQNKAKCFIDNDYTQTVSVAETACEFARRYIDAYKTSKFSNPCVDLSNQLISDAKACGCTLPGNLFNGKLSTQNCLELDYNGTTVDFNKNCWATAPHGTQFEKLFTFIEKQNIVKMRVQKA